MGASSIPLHRVLAIDPGYDRVGFAVLEKNPREPKERVLYSDCFTTSKTDDFTIRLKQVGDELERLIKEWSPERVALEKLYVAVNQKTAMAVSEVRGMMLYLAACHDLFVVEYTPLEVKSAVAGDGHADKKQVMAMVPRLVVMEKEPRYDDEYDAVAIGITAIARWR